jgi:hypothetical protein
MRTVMISLLLLTTGCATQSGIVDVFAPASAQPVVSVQRIVCEPAPESTAGGTAATVAPCVGEVVAAAVAGKTTRPFDQRGRRPLPPRRLR